jgi:hypothetical protein
MSRDAVHHPSNPPGLGSLGGAVGRQSDRAEVGVIRLQGAARGKDGTKLCAAGLGEPALELEQENRGPGSSGGVT